MSSRYPLLACCKSSSSFPPERARLSRKTTGEVWFDRLAIRQISKLARATNAELTGIVSRNTPKNEGGKQHESFPVSDQPSEEEGGAESAQRDSPINSTANDTSIPTDNASAPKTETRP